ncbi:hypothetical protein [Kitasatospora sp. NPDC056531]|uniref:hypothetical protein n=1 Tax=Kitasatospora sp. NPDC056531 TaxID=3345856 RepID=UPI0036B708D6
MSDEQLWHRLDRVRREHGLLTPGELMVLADHGVAVLDPFSALVSRRVTLRAGTVLYPGAVVECDEWSSITFGPDIVLYGGAHVTAADGARIVIGRGCLLGEGGTRIKAATDDLVEIGSEVRITNGAELTGSCHLGDGAQILGPISARAVDLAAGRPFSHPDPDGRGGVLKGYGRAHGVRVGTGEVLNGNGDFESARVERQRTYHPEAPRLTQ